MVDINDKFGIISIMVVFSTMVDINDKFGGIMSIMVVFRLRWEDTVLCNLSTMRDVMITWEVFRTMGYSNNKRFIPSVVLMISPMCIMISPHQYRISLSVLFMISPTVLKMSPTFIMISPHGTEHPPRYSRYLHMRHIPHSTAGPLSVCLTDFSFVCGQFLHFDKNP